jgi:pimeloyl-ACP methyl ester carboxylesterase
MRNALRTARFCRTWLGRPSAARETILPMDREGRSARARLFVPEGRGPFPTWILLHGISRTGLEHPQLLRFARALASTGTLVIIPEVPEWVDLHLAPEATLPTVLAALNALEGLPDAKAPYGLMGFSFGGPQALVVASHDQVAPHLAGVASFGGYCDLARTLLFQFLGEHEWEGERETLDPDPYGRWVVGANYLTVGPGFGDAEDVANALWQLAADAGDTGAPSASPMMDGYKATLRGKLARERRWLFDLFAPPAGTTPDRAGAEAVVAALADAGRRLSPLMEPAPFTARIRGPVDLIHGRGDVLIPYTESLRMRERMPEAARANLTITRLFAHTHGERFPVTSAATELWRFLRALGGVVGRV